MGGSTTRQLAGRRKDQTKLNQRSQLRPGDMLQERYKIMGTLGVGGFSSVYQARDMRFSSVTRLCAIKEMLNTSNDSETRELALRSFKTESSILATLEHPAVPDVYDYFSERERSYLVMEYIRGKDLEATLEGREEPVPQDEALEWALQVCEVLTYLHSQKPRPLVFRDLKPSNIMLDQHGNIRLIDFGIAKVFQQGAKGTMIGTEGYSPPEQYRGEASPAGDVYALGATLHHVLTLKDPRMEPPFSWQERPVSDLNPTVSAAFQSIIERCLSYKAGDRFTNAMDLKQALEMLKGTPQESSSTPTATAEQTADQPAATAAPQAKAKGESTVPPPPQPNKKKRAAGDIQPIWRFKCEDEIRSKPCVTDSMIMVGAYDNNLYALKRQGGEFLWKYPAKDGIGSSPTTHKSNVFIGSTDEHLYCINKQNGNLQWRYKTKGAIYSSPAYAFDYVFFGSDDGHLHAVNMSNGRKLWSVQSHSAIRSSPLVTDDAVYYGTEGGYVFCLDMRGDVKWQFQAKRAVTSSPVMAEDMIFVGSMDSTVYAVDAGSGWAVWRARTTRPVISSPAVAEDTVYIGSSDGGLYAFDLYSGRQIWQFETDGQVASSPAVFQNHVYFGSTDGHVYCLETKKGKLNWKFRTGGYVISSPTIHDGIVYIGSSDHYLYALPV